MIKEQGSGSNGWLWTLSASFCESCVTALASTRPADSVAFTFTDRPWYRAGPTLLCPGARLPLWSISKLYPDRRSHRHLYVLWEQPLNINTGTIRPNRCLPLWADPNLHLRLSRGSRIVYAKYVCTAVSGIIKTQYFIYNETRSNIPSPSCPGTRCSWVMWSCYAKVIYSAKRWLSPHCSLSMVLLISSLQQHWWSSYEYVGVWLWGGVHMTHTQHTHIQMNKHGAEHISLRD